MSRPQEIAVSASEVGEQKGKNTILKLIILGIMAGIFIAFAGVGATFGNIYVGKIAGACIFPAGLAMVVVAGSELFTGNSLMVVALFSKKISVKQLLKNWFFVYLGNFIGALLVAFLVCCSGVFDQYSDAIIATAVTKSSLPFSDALVRGVLCNMLVCIAVWMSFGANTVFEKIAAVFFPVMIFVLCGFEHSIANMYYIPVGIFESLRTTGTSSIGLADALLNNLLPVTLGNIIGGVFIGSVYYWVYLKSQKSFDNFEKKPRRIIKPLTEGSFMRAAVLAKYYNRFIESRRKDGKMSTGEQKRVDSLVKEHLKLYNKDEIAWAQKYEQPFREWLMSYPMTATYVAAVCGKKKASRAIFQFGVAVATSQQAKALLLAHGYTWGPSGEEKVVKSDPIYSYQWDQWTMWYQQIRTYFIAERIRQVVNSAERRKAKILSLGGGMIPERYHLDFNPNRIDFCVCDKDKNTLSDVPTVFHTKTAAELKKKYGISLVNSDIKDMIKKKKYRETMDMTYISGVVSYLKDDEIIAILQDAFATLKPGASLYFDFQVNKDNGKPSGNFLRDIRLGFWPTSLIMRTPAEATKIVKKAFPYRIVKKATSATKVDEKAIIVYRDGDIDPSPSAIKTPVTANVLFEIKK